MPTKLEKLTLPSGHERNDFECFGPVASKDTELDGMKMIDLGCFQQEAKGKVDEDTGKAKTIDSNKYYHIAVVKSSKNGTFYAYFEWGKTVDGKPNKPNFQFTECSTEVDALAVCFKQAKAKNTLRGTWERIGSKDRFVPKVDSKGKKKDLYVVRPLASRAVGLPAAENICNEDAVGPTAAPKKTTKKTTKDTLDTQTSKLFRDLLGGAVTYTKSVMVGGTSPTQSALDDARDLLQDALKRIKNVGGKIENQVADNDLKQLTYSLYGMVPKIKKARVKEADWILTQDNVLRWQDDLDAFETALKSADVEESEDSDVMQGIPANVRWIDPRSDVGEWLYAWWPKSTRNRHGHVGKMKVHGVWEVERHGDRDILKKAQEATLGEMPKSWNNERPLFQEKKRPDLDAAGCRRYWDSNTAMMFHGTRSVNVPGIIRENLRFPSQLTGVVITGAMFGPGSYFADDWKKSAGYCSDPNSYYGGGGEVKGRKSFMFACDVICGNPHVANGAHGYTSPPKGSHCVYGKAGKTSSWGGALMNNEWIIYRKGRQELRYLAEVSW